MPKRLNFPAIRRGPVEQWQNNGVPVCTALRVRPEFVSRTPPWSFARLVCHPYWVFSVPCSFPNFFSVFFRFFLAEIIAFSAPCSSGRSSSGADAHMASVRICQWPLAPMPSSIVSRSHPVQRPLFLLTSSLSHNSLRFFHMVTRFVEGAR